MPIAKVKEIESGAEILPRCPYPELRDAYALYREAVSSNNPFHAFLTFWKVYEEAMYVRKGWGAKHKRSDTRVREEVFPDLFVFGARPEELANPSEKIMSFYSSVRSNSEEKSLRGPGNYLTILTAWRSPTLARWMWASR